MLYITTEGLIETMLHQTLTFVFSLFILQASLPTVSNISLLVSAQREFVEIVRVTQHWRHLESH